ncbi:MAG: carbohydrate-binding domain-containing protein, partial [Bacilli bacterium]|nr:carbohydrate-binding domain-containing protein [Bacilli bacterium]
MSRAKTLLIPLSLLLLASCSASKENNYDSDPISDITTDEGPNSYDEISFEDEEVVVPESLPLCEDGLISEAGSFKLSGDYSEVHISAAKKSKIYLFLDGVSINSSSGKAFYSDNSITLYVVLLNGSTNTIINDFIDTNAFHIKGDLHIQGSGTLNITSKQKSGLKASKDLYITGESVTLNVKGNNHAIAARSVIIKKATVAVESETKDGIQAECDSDQLTFTKEQGFVYLEDAKISADTKGDGIQADTYVYVSGGEINIKTEGEFVQYSTANMSEYNLTEDDFKYKASGSTYVRVATDEIRTLNSSYYALANSVKGIKAGAIEYDSD